MVLMSLSISCVVLLITDLMFETEMAWVLAIVAWVTRQSGVVGLPARSHAAATGAIGQVRWVTVSSGRSGVSTDPTG